MPYRAASLDTPRQPSFRSAIGPPPRRVVCFVNHRLTVSSSSTDPSHAARRRRRTVHSHTRTSHTRTLARRTLAHSHSCPLVHSHTRSLVFRNTFYVLHRVVSSRGRCHHCRCAWPPRQSFRCPSPARQLARLGHAGLLSCLAFVCVCL